MVGRVGVDDPGDLGILTLAVDWRPTYSAQPGLPILYVGGDAGVYRAMYNGSVTTWERYTGAVNGASSDGGGMPVVKITDLDLALGNIDRNTGRAIPNGSPDMLVATTLGRGTWGIIVEAPVGTVGPRVIEFSPTTPQFTPVTQVMIKFDMFIEPSEVSVADVVVTGPNGQIIPIDSIVEDPPPVSGPDLHDVWLINFAGTGLAAGRDLHDHRRPANSVRRLVDGSGRRRDSRRTGPGPVRHEGHRWPE